MSWVAVAKKDFRDALRARLFWALSALFLLLIAGLTYAYVGTDVFAGDASTLGLVFFIASSMGLFVSLTAIVISYKSIAGERESGSMKILLSLPHTRRDVVLGKVLGRAGVLAVPVVVAMAGGAVVGGIVLGDIEILGTVSFTIIGLLFVLAYIGIAVGISAMTGSTSKAAALGIGFFMLFELFWDIVILAAAYVTSGFELPGIGEYPEWTFILSQLQPSTAFGTALVAVIPDSPTGTFGTGPGGEQIDAFYATPWLGVVVLLFWLVVPPLLGYLRFQQADL